MRFDDRLATLLAWPDGDAGLRERLWLHLVDLLAWGAPPCADAAIARLRALTPSIAVETRRAAAERLAGRALPPALVAWFAEDADVARPLLAAVVLTEADWAALLPRLPATACAILAARHDLPSAIARRLGRCEAADVRGARPPVLPAPGAPAAASAVDTAPADPVKALLARIEAFRSPGSATAGDFDLVIDAAGTIVQDDGLPLDARLGRDPRGVDGQALGAWRAGEPIADARLVIAAGPRAGEWRLTASPAGPDGSPELHPTYRGVARRPRADETAAPLASAEPDRDARAAPGRLDRAIDAVRAPLAGLIEPELTVALDAAAADIVSRGLELADAIERFDLAGSAADPGDVLDVACVVQRLHAALSPLAAARGVALSVRIARGLAAVDADPLAVERMVSRLFGASLGVARAGERLVVKLASDRHAAGCVALTFTRPGRLVGRPAQRLRTLDDPAGGADAPLMAFGFALRLVERLAAESGGTLAIHDDRLRLSLPQRRIEPGRRRG